MAMSQPVPEIEQVTTFTAIIGSTPVVIVLPRVRATVIAESGALVTADAWTTALLAHGAQPMRDIEFHDDPAAGWTITIGAGLTAVRISGPAGLGDIYDGELVADTAWRERVAGLHHLGAGLVVISGTVAHPTPDAALEMMEQDRAVCVRVATALD